MIDTAERQFWIDVIAALKLLISVIERHKLGKGKQPVAVAVETPAGVTDWERRNDPAA
jgi:hypothetical protein